MSEAELQTDSEELETGVTIETGEDLAPSEPEAKAPEGFIKAEDAQKDINKQHRKYRDEERARKKIEAEAEALRKELEELRTKDIDLSIPPVPDQYSDNYDEQVRARDEAIQRKAAYDAQVKQNEAATARNAEQAKNDQLEADRQKVQAFDSNVVQLGLNTVDVRKAADSVMEYGISEALEDVVLEDPDGPLLVTYLAENPVELETLNSMSAYQLFNHVSELKQKASILRPQTSKAPPPPEILDGGGGGEIEDPSLKGVIFE